MLCEEMRWSAAHPHPFDLDSLPEIGHDDRSARPVAGFSVVQREPGEPVHDRGEEAAQVGGERTGHRLIGELVVSVFVDVEEAVVREYCVPLLDQLGAYPVVPEIL